MQSGQDHSSKHYFCDCSKHCGNRRQEVSQATYYRHAQARQLDQFSPAFTEFLRSEPPAREPAPRWKRQPVASAEGSSLNKRQRKGKARETEGMFEGSVGFDDLDMVRIIFLLLVYSPMLFSSALRMPRTAGLQPVLLDPRQASRAATLSSHLFHSNHPHQNRHPIQKPAMIVGLTLVVSANWTQTKSHQTLALMGLQPLRPITRIANHKPESIAFKWTKYGSPINSFRCFEAPP